LKQIIFILAVSLLLGGCATSKINEHLNENLPKEHLLKLEFIPQKKNLCGPTVLKMASQQYLPKVPFETYKQFTFREKAEGTFKSDMISSTRRLGLSPYRVPTLETMFQEIDQGRPVIIFQNLGLSWYTMWHYSLLVGYNSEKNIVYLHSGTTPYDHMGFSLFVRTWHRGENWSYVVVPPDVIPDHATIDEALDNATVFENLKEKELAKKVYAAMSTKWPDRFEPYLGLANLFYEEKNLKEAIQEILLALKASPNHPALLYNLASLYHETGESKKAQELKKKTLAAAPPDEKEIYIRKFTF
jgi:tetratricopeptide (TPR) repeat protein